MSRTSYKEEYERIVKANKKLLDRVYNLKDIVGPLKEENKNLRRVNNQLKKDNDMLNSVSSIEFNFKHEKSLQKLGVSGIESEYFSGAFSN